jgi:hypothetical protein
VCLQALPASRREAMVLEQGPETIDAWAYDFLRNWPSLGEAKRAREITLRTFFHHHGVRGENASPSVLR